MWGWTLSTPQDIKKVSVLETLLSCFDEERVETPKIVNLQRALLPLGEALSFLRLISNVMGEKLQPFMDFAVGADAEVAARFCFLNARAQISSS